MGESYAKLGQCAVLGLMDELSGRWILQVSGVLIAGPVRFNSLRRQVDGITQKMLTHTLKVLERGGLVSRTVIPGPPISVEYAITPLGRTLIDAFAPLHAWAEAHKTDVEQSQREFDIKFGDVRRIA